MLLVGLLVVGVLTGWVALRNRSMEPELEQKRSAIPAQLAVRPPAPPADSPQPPSPAPVSQPLVAQPSEQENRLARLVASLNRQRIEEGRPSVTLDPALSQGCQEHAHYLAQNVRTVVDLDRHDQDETHPGSSAAGKAVARRVSAVAGDPEDALSEWLQKPAHRAWLLDPALRRVGIGFARMPDGKWISVFDWLGGREPAQRKPTDPVLFPAPGQREVPLAFPGNEIPDPLPAARIKVAGYPITVTFPEGRVVPDVRAWLEDETGADVPVWFSSPTRPANKEHPREQANTACLIARQPLRPGTRYVVHFEARVGDEDWSACWSFTTVSPQETNRRIYVRALDRLNQFRKGSGLEPLRLDDRLGPLCVRQAQRIAQQLDRLADKDEVPPEVPAGSSEQEQLIATRSLIRTGGGSGPVDAIDWIFESVLNRHLALNPSATTVAMGAVQLSPRGWVWVIHIPTQRRDGDGPPAILFPAPDQKEVPIYFGRPISSLVPDQPADRPTGFPITANFFPHRQLSEVQAELLGPTGESVPCWLSTPQKPLPGTGTYRQILLLPRQPLLPASVYTVRLSGRIDGDPWNETWSFHTIDFAQKRRETTQQLLDALNAARALAGLSAVRLEEKLSVGCQKHAEYLVRNLDEARTKGLGIHEEFKDLPGYTPEGAKAGQASVIAVLPDPSESVSNWLATLYHRIPLLNPRLKRIGYGQAQHPSRGWVTVLDVGQGR